MPDVIVNLHEPQQTSPQPATGHGQVITLIALSGLLAISVGVNVFQFISGKTVRSEPSLTVIDPTSSTRYLTGTRADLLEKNSMDMIAAMRTNAEVQRAETEVVQPICVNTPYLMKVTICPMLIDSMKKMAANTDGYASERESFVRQLRGGEQTIIRKEPQAF